MHRSNVTAQDYDRCPVLPVLAIPRWTLITLAKCTSCFSSLVRSKRLYSDGDGSVDSSHADRDSVGGRDGLVAFLGFHRYRIHRVTC